MVVGEILASSTELYKEDPQLNQIQAGGGGGTPDFKSWGWSKDFFGFEIFHSGIFGVGNNLKICGGTRVSPGHVVLQMKYNQICFATFFKVRKFGMEFFGGVNFWTMDFFGVLILHPFHHPCYLKSRVTSPPPPPLGNLIQIHWIDYTKSLRFERGLCPSLTKGIKSPFYCRYLVGKIH